MDARHSRLISLHYSKGDTHRDTETETHRYRQAGVVSTSKSNYPLRLCFIFDKKPARHTNEFKLLSQSQRRCRRRRRRPRNYLSRACEPNLDVCDDVLLYYKCKMTAKLPTTTHIRTHTHTACHTDTRTVRATTLDKIIWQESIKFYAFNVLANYLSAVCVSLKLHTYSWHPPSYFPCL